MSIINSKAVFWRSIAYWSTKKKIIIYAILTSLAVIRSFLKLL